MKKILEVFAGEYVKILLKLRTTSKKEDEQGISSRSGPLLISGYLLDIDGGWMLLGDTPDAVTDAVKVRLVAHIGLSQPYDQYEKTLDEAVDTGKGH